MKEIEKVSIAGIAFMLDQDAFTALDNYLDSLKTAYRAEPDASEIIADIEARIAELILGSQDASRVVDRPLIEGIIAQMGAPEIDPTTAPLPESAFPRRLYRNRQEAKLGGVCSGIATFFDIDPVWVRLSVFAPLILLVLSAPLPHFGRIQDWLGILTGLFFMLYFLLWIVVPAARSPRQKLEARGERITASSIETSLRREFADTSKAVRAGSVWGELFVVLGRVVLFGLKAIAWIVGVSLMIAVMSILAALGAALFAPASLDLGQGTFEAFIGTYPVGMTWVIVLGLIVALIPLVVMIWMLYCLIFERPLRGRWVGATMLAWIVLVGGLGGLTLKAARDFQGAHWDRIRIERLEPGHLRIESIEPSQPRGYRIERTIPEGEPTPFDSIRAAATADSSAGEAIISED